MAIIRKNYNLKIYKPFKELPSDSMYNWLTYYNRLYINYKYFSSKYQKKMYEKTLKHLNKYFKKHGVKFI